MIKNLMYLSIYAIIMIGCSSIEEKSTTNDSTRCSQIKTSISEAGFSDVTVTCDDTYAYIASDTYPDHDLMNGITGTNEQIPVPAYNYSAPIPISPSGTSEMYSRDSSLGVAVNGVPIYDWSSGGDLSETDLVNALDSAYDSTYDDMDTALLGQLDNCGGHSGKGDDYHYHKKPTCMVSSMSDDTGIIGWAFDGYPLYGDIDDEGSRTGLDTCNGIVDDTYGYRYHTSTDRPYIFQCLVGTIPDEDSLPIVTTLKKGSGTTTSKPTGTPVTVTDLTFTDSNGTIRLDYTYSGSPYYIEYTESDSDDNCYDFTWSIITNSDTGSGTYCRE